MEHNALASPIRIFGTGEYIPSRRVNSTEFDTRWNKATGWTRRHVGIDYRQFAEQHETASIMATRAAEDALARAGMRADEVDCVISACSVMEQAIPCTAALVHRQLGLAGSGIPAFDVNATCLSFVTALDLIACAITAGRYRKILIVSSEIPSAGLNWKDQDTAALFGDGAAAVVVGMCTPEDGSQYIAGHMETYSEGLEFCQVRSCGTRIRIEDGIDAFIAGAYFEMSGKATYRLAAKHLPGFIERLFRRANISIEEIQKFVPHQASAKALKHLEVALRLPKGSMVHVLATRGNQMAASIPIALHHAIMNGEIKRGDLIALVGSGAGLSFGGAVLRY
ncbi:MAG: beta-ketoacyl-ACP synthase 3 [Arenimonas sp.]|nr:beta-ketoacyl-ACP synthase 3 [Arenimonas sp.]